MNEATLAIVAFLGQAPGTEPGPRRAPTKEPARAYVGLCGSALLPHYVASARVPSYSLLL